MKVHTSALVGSRTTKTTCLHLKRISLKRCEILLIITYNIFITDMNGELEQNMHQLFHKGLLSKLVISPVLFAAFDLQFTN